MVQHVVQKVVQKSMLGDPQVQVQGKPGPMVLLSFYRHWRSRQCGSTRGSKGESKGGSKELLGDPKVQAMILPPFYNHWRTSQCGSKRVYKGGSKEHAGRPLGAGPKTRPDL